MKVTFNRPYLTGNEIKYITDAINRRKLCGDGYYTKISSEFIETKFNTKKALLTTSCSSALDMACLILDIGKGDEVILPSFTFVSTANSVVLRGAKCIFVEVDKYLNIDLDDVERKISDKTKMVMPVHYASTSCDMDRLMAMSEKHGFYVVEDAAQAVYAKYKDRYLGTIGHIGCYSFHETKNYSCGEGGAFLINVDDNKLVENAEIAREKGTNRSKFFRGEVAKYSWVGVGSSFLPSDMLAAFLYAQFEQIDKINELRKKVYDAYTYGLKGLISDGYFAGPLIPSYNKINYHMYYLMFRNGDERDTLMNYLKENGINAVFHYLPLHTSDMGLRMGYKEEDLPFTEKVSDCLLRLPLYAGMDDSDVEYVVEKINKFYR
jgi:dTDP-4-amino-4,6-dideoxygalactose transaminase